MCVFEHDCWVCVLLVCFQSWPFGTGYPIGMLFPEEDHVFRSQQSSAACGSLYGVGPCERFPSTFFKGWVSLYIPSWSHTWDHPLTSGFWTLWFSDKVWNSSPYIILSDHSNYRKHWTTLLLELPGCPLSFSLHFIHLGFFIYYLWNSISVCSPGWSWICRYSASASQVLGLGDLAST